MQIEGGHTAKTSFFWNTQHLDGVSYFLQDVYTMKSCFIDLILLNKNLNFIYFSTVCCNGQDLHFLNKCKVIN